MVKATGNSSYTIFVLPDPTSKPYSFSIRKKTCHILLGFLFSVILIITGVFVQSLSLFDDLSELSLLRSKEKKQHAQLQILSDAVSDLKKQMARLLELDRKLRVMTDLPPKEGGASSLAQGGTEEPLAALEEDFSLEQQRGEMKEMGVSLHKEIRELKRHITAEQESFKELIKTISEIQSRWASTPSIWPVKGWVTSSFGRRTSPFTGGIVMHNGIDIAARRGAQVISPATGIVSQVRYDHDLGRLVVIEHRFGKKTYFGHLDKQTVRKGQHVLRGEVIGNVGSTGRSTGPHLHYEVRINGISVDPTRYILN